MANPTPENDGFDLPNTTPIPNSLFDNHLIDMNKAELKVVMGILRLTLGWKHPKGGRTRKKICRISTRNLAKKTGLSRASVKKGAEAAEQRGLLKCHRDGGVTEWEIVWNDPPYMGVNGGLEIDPPEQSSGPEIDPLLDQKLAQGGPEISPPSIKETLKETSKEKTSVENKKSIRKDEDWNPLFDSLAEVCSVDPKTSGSSLAKITDVLFKAEYRDVDVRQFGRWWVSDDFRKSRGIPPTLWQLQEQIGIVKTQHAQANTENGQRLIESVEEKQKALREELGLEDGEFLKAPDA